MRNFSRMAWVPFANKFSRIAIYVVIIDSNKTKCFLVVRIKLNLKVASKSTKAVKLLTLSRKFPNIATAFLASFFT